MLMQWRMSEVKDWLLADRRERLVLIVISYML